MSCPICGTQTAQKYRPFCSRRCADIDLAKWLGGAYAVPSQDPEDLAEAIEATEQELAKQPPSGKSDFH